MHINRFSPELPPKYVKRSSSLGHLSLSESQNILLINCNFL